MRGIANFLIDCHRKPQFAKKIMDMRHKFNMQVAKALADVGAEVILYDDDYADLKGPLLSPKIWRELVKPYQHDFVREFRKRGLWVIEHSDGNLTPILSDLVEPGLSGLHPIEPAAMEISDVKRKFGDRICVIGNVDCGNTMTLGTEDDVRRDVRRCIDEASPGGGHVLSASNTLHWQIPVRNVLAMVDEAKKYGRYPLGR
jgi:uroporphyrinogen decarboxylase